MSKEPFDDIPRRSRLDMHCRAELAIRRAVDEIERMGASPFLTDAINLLHHGRHCVAEYVDLHPSLPECQPPAAEQDLDYWRERALAAEREIAQWAAGERRLPTEQL